MVLHPAPGQQSTVQEHTKKEKEKKRERESCQCDVT